MSTQHTLLKGHECPPAPHKALFPLWSPTQAQKCPQRQTWLSLGPSASVPAVASLEKCQCPAGGAALHPLLLSWGTTPGLWGAFERGSRASATGLTQRCHRQSQAGWPRCHLPSHEVLLCCPLPGESHPGTCMEQGREEVFQSCY